MSFNQFKLHKKITNLIDAAGFKVPTDIQIEAIPKILEKKDLRASAQTGTGKTAAFLLPAIQRLLDEGSPKSGPGILILVPTRELACQVAEEAQKFGAGLFKTVCIYGGVPYPKQNRMLRSPYDILVATPGRLIDQLDRRQINLRGLLMLVLDEADRMLDMGFIEPVEKIVKQCPPSRQTLLFSATLSNEILKLSNKLLRDPVQIEITSKLEKHESIEEHFQETKNINHKHELLNKILERDEVDQAIVFTATKRASDELADKLSEEGYDASALHGDMDQRSRTRTINAFRQKRIRFLIATDVAARGIDIATISHVINFDLPRVPEDYVHRIGRTGRAGSKGTALSFVGKKDLGALKGIERYTGQKTSLFQNERSPKKNGPFKKKSFSKPFRKKSFQKGPKKAR